MTLDEITERFRADLAATGGRTAKIADGAAQVRDERIARAERALEREKAAAHREYEEAVAKTSVARQRTAAEATRKFDAACRGAVGAPAELWIHQAGADLELRHGTAPTVLARAIDGGSGGWSVMGGPGGRTFLGSGTEAGIAARKMLWVLAGKVPMPA